MPPTPSNHGAYYKFLISLSHFISSPVNTGIARPKKMMALFDNGIHTYEIER